MLLGELRGEQKEHGERNDVKWNRLNEKLYVRSWDVNAKRRKENRIYVFILSFIYFQCALRHTRNYQHLVNLPQVKTECGRKGFYYLAGKEFNDLPLSARKIESRLLFRQFLENHFM